MTSRIESGETGPLQPGARTASQNVVAGLVLIALAGLALWLTSDLPRGTLGSAGAGMLPQAVAALMGACGVLLLIGNRVKGRGEPIPAFSFRGPAFVTAGIALFALTIKPMHFGSLATPELGLVLSGPLAIVVGGFAAPRARPRDLAVLALALTPFCMLLFGDMLNLPIPLIPRPVAEAVFAGWSYKGALRVTALVLFAAAAVVHFTTRDRPASSSSAVRHDGSP